MNQQLCCLLDTISKLDPIVYQHLIAIDATNMFFCYRMFLVLFRREFRLSQVFAVWEALFSHNFGPAMHIFVAFGFMETFRGSVLAIGDADELLAACLNHKPDAGQVLDAAMSLHDRYNIEAIENNWPKIG